jgi:polar amino acid transport system substrate-binding protein
VLAGVVCSPDSSDAAQAERIVTMPPRIIWGAAALASTLLLFGAASAGAAPAGAAGEPAMNAKLAAEVPAAIRKKGMLIVAADASYAPNEFIASDGHTVVGMDPDLAHALGAVLGLKMNVVNANFSGIIPGLASGKYGLGMSSFTDTLARQKIVDFVTYFSAGTSFFVKTQGGPAIETLANLCGHTVAVESGTTEQADATAQAAKCAKTGKPKETVSAFPDQSSANLALSSGRAQVGMADSPVAAYQVKQSKGEFKLVGKAYGTAPYGIAVPKGSGMAPPILAALKVLMADGKYLAILKSWGIASGAISDPKINGATS